MSAVSPAAHKAMTDLINLPTTDRLRAIAYAMGYTVNAEGDGGTFMSFGTAFKGFPLIEVVVGVGEKMVNRLREMEAEIKASCARSVNIEGESAINAMEAIAKRR